VQLVDAPEFDSASVVTTNAHLLDGLWTVGGATGLTGGGLDWLARTLGAADAADAYARWGDEIDALRPGAAGALGYPTLTGQRFPYWDLEDRGGLRGLTPLHRPSHLVAAFQEGAAFLVRAGLRETARFAPAPDRVRVVGGVARRADLLQTRADIWGVPVEGIADGMATSRGAAVLAALAANLFASVGEAVAAVCPAGVVYEPDASAAAAYDEIFTRWELARTNS
jgi:sugar (pentulose or hexulose) kinase